MRWILAALVVAAVLAGCGSAGSQPAPTSTSAAPRTLVYSDPVYHFSFQYPTSWSIPRRKGTTEQVEGVPSYVVDINMPGDTAHTQIVADRNIVPFPPFTEGHIGPDPSGNPNVTLHFHHLSVSGWPSMGIERYVKSTPDEFNTIINTHSLSYQVRMLAGQPPFTQSQVDGYRLIIRTLKVPF